LRFVESDCHFLPDGIAHLCHAINRILTRLNLWLF
jgi:hypothetical protein